MPAHRATMFHKEWRPTQEIKGVFNFKTDIQDPGEIGPPPYPTFNAVIFSLAYGPETSNPYDIYIVRVNGQDYDLIEEIRAGLETRLGQTVTVEHIDGV